MSVHSAEFYADLTMCQEVEVKIFLSTNLREFALSFDQFANAALSSGSGENS